MGCNLKRKILKMVIDDLLFEDMSYGIYDRPGPVEELDSDYDVTVKPEVPLIPTSLMSVQLADERPPIEDDEYVPTSVSDLRSASSAIAALVPPDQVEAFYRRIIELLDDVQVSDVSDSVAKSTQEIEEDTPVEPGDVSKDVKEARRRIERLLEVYWGDIKLGRHDDPDDDDMSDMDTPDPVEVSVTDEKTVLAKLAKEFGYSGVPGIRQALQRLFSLIKYLLVKVGPDAIETMMGTVVPEYVNLSVDLGLIDEEDATALMMSPVYVRELDSFRYYYNSLYRPVYKKLKSEAEKSAKQMILDLGIPKEVQDTVFNQVTGGAARKDSTIASKLKKKMSPDEVRDVLNLVRDNYTNIKGELDKIPEDLLDRTHDHVDRMGDKKKKNILLKSFGHTQEFQKKETGGKKSSRRRKKK